MKPVKIKNIITMILLIGINSVKGRSPLRRKDPLLPEITIQWEDSNKIYRLRSSHLEEYPIFAFDAKDYKKNNLPKTNITHAAGLGMSNGATLSTLIEEVIKDIEKHKRHFKHFTVLQDKNFNYIECYGLIVLKFNDHPFVLKLFIERPDTIYNIYNKGVEPLTFFYMSGGTTRHITGLSRIINRENVLAKINKMPAWQGKIHIPRKWFWTPENKPWIKIVGKNIGKKKNPSISLPGTYAIIADAVDTKQKNDLSSSQQRKIIMDLCNDLNLFIDPHSNNFVFNKNPITGDIMITILDTEHFPSMVGFKKNIKFNDHVEWFFHLTGKFIKDAYFRTKEERRAAQEELHELALSMYRDEGIDLECV